MDRGKKRRGDYKLYLEAVRAKIPASTTSMYASSEKQSHDEIAVQVCGHERTQTDEEITVNNPHQYNPQGCVLICHSSSTHSEQQEQNPSQLIDMESSAEPLYQPAIDLNEDNIFFQGDLLLNEDMVIHNAGSEDEQSIHSMSSRGSRSSFSTNSGRQGYSQGSHSPTSSDTWMNDDHSSLSGSDCEQLERNVQESDEASTDISSDSSNESSSDTVSEHSSEDSTESRARIENFKDLKAQLAGDYAEKISTPVTATKGELLLMALSLARQHSFNNKAFVDTVNLINSAFGSPVLPSSKYLLDKLLECDLGLERHFFCKECKSYYSVVTESSQQKSFYCAQCKAFNDISCTSISPHFVTFDVPAQLELLFNKPDTAQVNLFNPRHALERDEGIYRDVYDGQSYKAFVKKFVIHEPDTIRVLSFNFCVDGTPLFSASACEIWPLNIMIWELPLSLRMSNLILAGLWFGKGKPDMNTFFHPFVNHINSMTSGFKINVNQEVWNMKAFLIASCVDSGARGSVQCISTHGGYFSCNWCEIPGVYVDGHVRYPPGDEPATPRTHENLLRNGKAYIERMKKGRYAFPPNSTSLQKAEFHKGVKGVSKLFECESMNLVDGFIVEHAHNAYLGIVRQFLSIWETKYSKHLSEINGRIKQLTPPIEVRRFPRAMDDKTHFKAKECENWLLYFSVPVMFNILPQNLLMHWMHFAQAYHLLSRTEVTIDDVRKAQILLTQFSFMLSEMYSATDHSFNCHINLHVPQNVIRWGPLFVTSGLGFEAGNGDMKSVIHSAEGIPHQICRVLAQDQALQVLKNHCHSEKTRNFQASIASRQHAKKAILTETCMYLGKSTIFLPTNTESWLCDRLNLDPKKFILFGKILKSGIVFTSASRKMGKRDNSVALLVNNDIVTLQKIILDEEANKGFVFCYKLKCETVFVPPRAVHLPYKDHFIFRVVYVTQDLLLLPVDDLKMICVRSKHHEGDFVSPMPNINNIY